MRVGGNARQRPGRPGIAEAAQCAVAGRAAAGATVNGLVETGPPAPIARCRNCRPPPAGPPDRRGLQQWRPVTWAAPSCCTGTPTDCQPRLGPLRVAGGQPWLSARGCMYERQDSTRFEFRRLSIWERLRGVEYWSDMDGTGMRSERHAPPILRSHRLVDRRDRGERRLFRHRLADGRWPPAVGSPS